MSTSKDGFANARIFETAQVPAGGCTDLSAHFTRNGTISGRVIQADGSPASGIQVGLGTLLPDGSVRRLIDQWVRTEADGSFLIVHVPVGKLVVITGTNRPQVQLLPASFWYAPGVPAAKDARIFNLHQDENITGVEFRLRPFSAATK